MVINMLGQSRVCTVCKMDRIPEESIVKQKGKKYVVYICKCCKARDIERYEDRPRIKIWNGAQFIDETEEINDCDSDQAE